MSSVLPAETEDMQERRANFLHKLSFAAGTRRAARSSYDRAPAIVGSEAVAAGVVSRHELATRFDAIYRNVYVPRGALLTPADKAHAAWLWSGRQATVVGVSAAAMHGAKWIDSRLPAELNQRSQHKTKGIVLHNDTLLPDETVVIRGIPVTTAARTAFDLGRRYGRTLAVIRVDALLQVTAVQLSAVDSLIDRHRGARGIVQLREVGGLADSGSESPQETRTRLVLTDAGVRPQETQINVFDRYGDHVRRIDMGWRDWKVGVEYDGEQHWTNPAIRAKDIDTQARLEEIGLADHSR
jgi:hypothetical protein